jgi:hypothetical protein
MITNNDKNLLAKIGKRQINQPMTTIHTLYGTLKRDGLVDTFSKCFPTMIQNVLLVHSKIVLNKVKLKGVRDSTPKYIEKIKTEKYLKNMILQKHKEFCSLIMLRARSLRSVKTEEKGLHDSKILER